MPESTNVSEKYLHLKCRREGIRRREEAIVEAEDNKEDGDVDNEEDCDVDNEDDDNVDNDDDNVDDRNKNVEGDGELVRLDNVERGMGWANLPTSEWREGDMDGHAENEME